MKKTYIQPLVTVESEEIENQLLADSEIIGINETDIITDESNVAGRDDEIFSAW